MTIAPAVPTPAPASAALRTLLWHYPEWWTYGLCALAWATAAAHAVQTGAHGIHHTMTFTAEVAHWLVMVYAMMLPLIGDQLRAAARASLWSRRQRAIVCSLLGYSIVWLLPGVVAVLMRARPVTHTYAAPTIAFVVAALWQLTPVHAFALAGCHRPPLLAATGWRADRDCVRFGAALGWQCVVSCAPLMVACALTGHALICMAGCMALGIAERRSFRPRTRTAAAGAMVFAGYYLLLALR
jgi:hypothetical protein